MLAAGGGALKRVLAMFKGLEESSRAAVGGSKRLGSQEEVKDNCVLGENDKMYSRWSTWGGKLDWGEDAGSGTHGPKHCGCTRGRSSTRLTSASRLWTGEI